MISKPGCLPKRSGAQDNLSRGSFPYGLIQAICKGGAGAVGRNDLLGGIGVTDRQNQHS
jgi:hypothetical protein